MPQSRTRWQNCRASDTVKLPCASHMISTSGPSASRAAMTRLADAAGEPSYTPMRIFTAPNPPLAR